MTKNDVIRFNAIIGKEIAKHIPQKYIDGINWGNIKTLKDSISPEEYRKLMECNFNIEDDNERIN